MDAVQFYKCLADETRLQSLLMMTQTEPVCVCDIQTQLQLSQPKISRHLAQLRNCGLVIATRRGKWMYYQLNPELPNWCVSVLVQTLQNSELGQAQLKQRHSSGSCCEAGTC